MNSQVSNPITFDSVIIGLLKDIANEHDLKDYDIKEAGVAENGDGYFGVIRCVELKEIKNPTQKLLHLVVKSTTKDPKVRDKVPVENVFQREILVYTTIIPTLQQFLADKQLPAFPNFAKCYKTSTVKNSEALVMENLMATGHRLWERRLPMNEDHVVMVMKSYGRLHGLSLAFKDQYLAQYKKVTENFTNRFLEYFESADIKSMITTLCNEISNTINSKDNQDVAESYKSFVARMPDVIKGFGNNSDEYCAISHADCWTNNIMFKYDDPNSPNLPTQVRFIDLQMVTSRLPVLDIIHFFYSCSSKTIIDNYQNYLDIYYRSLSDYMKELGSDADKVYPYSVFLRHWKEYSNLGLILATLSIKIMLTEPNEARNIAELADSELTFADIFTHSISKIDEYHDRIRHIVLHFYKLGLLG